VRCVSFRKARLSGLRRIATTGMSEIPLGYQ
jgi:hypothetical protein